MRTKIEEQIIHKALQGDPVVYHTLIYAELKLRTREDEFPTDELSTIEGLVDRAIEEMKTCLPEKCFLNDGVNAYIRVWNRLISDNRFGFGFGSKIQKRKSSEGFIEICHKPMIDLELVFPISIDDFKLLTKGDREQKIFSGLDSLDSFFNGNRIYLKSGDEVLIDVDDHIRYCRNHGL